MMAHTPGPWRQNRDEPDDDTCRYWNIHVPGGNFAMMVYTSEDDARLIAAAPELLEWIKECEHCLAHNWSPNAKQRLIWNVRRIIAKAGGEPLEGP